MRAVVQKDQSIPQRKSRSIAALGRPSPAGLFLSLLVETVDRCLKIESARAAFLALCSPHQHYAELRYLLGDLLWPPSVALSQLFKIGFELVNMSIHCVVRSGMFDGVEHPLKS
jgi:hypothetical protein